MKKVYTGYSGLTTWQHKVLKVKNIISERGTKAKSTIYLIGEVSASSKTTKKVSSVMTAAGTVSVHPKLIKKISSTTLATGTLVASGTVKNEIKDRFDEIALDRSLDSINLRAI